MAKSVEKKEREVSPIYIIIFYVGLALFLLLIFFHHKHNHNHLKAIPKEKIYISPTPIASDSAKLNEATKTSTWVINIKYFESTGEAYGK